MSSGDALEFMPCPSNIAVSWVWRQHRKVDSKTDVCIVAILSDSVFH